MAKKEIIIVGAGAAGLLAAYRLAKTGKSVHIYEKQKAAGRKFLVAGHGGFNLTHNEALAQFVQRYDQVALQPIIQHFDNQATRQWLQEIGIPTFVGSSGKIFPEKGIKPINVLQAILAKLESYGVVIHYQHKLLDFDTEHVHFQSIDGVKHIAYDTLILGLGGGSWAKTGSDAAWISLFQQKGIPINPLQPANSGLHTQIDLSAFAGQILKNIRLSYGPHSKQGDLVWSKYGIEGSPVYYLNRFIREASFPLAIHVDLKPMIGQESLLTSFRQHSGNTSSFLRDKLRLPALARALLKTLDKASYTDPQQLIWAIKHFPIMVTAFRPIDEVISTAGGVSFEALHPNLALKDYPNIHCIGEMLDWEAPTGGYLLQACFSSGAWVADNLT